MIQHFQQTQVLPHCDDGDDVSYEILSHDASCGVFHFYDALISYFYAWTCCHESVSSNGDVSICDGDDDHSHLLSCFRVDDVYDSSHACDPFQRTIYVKSLYLFLFPSS